MSFLCPPKFKDFVPEQSWQQAHHCSQRTWSGWASVSVHSGLTVPHLLVLALGKSHSWLQFLHLSQERTNQLTLKVSSSLQLRLSNVFF